jgi:DNA-binding CsgD family transcriptional regulator
LFGRGVESEALARLVAEARDGRSNVLVLRGEPGIGKTALLEQLVVGTVGARVLYLAGIESENELAFAGLHQLCAPMLDRRDVLPEPQQAALGVALGLASGETPNLFLVALATLTLLVDAAEDDVVLCVVDDAEWLDQASLQVLGFVARRMLAEPIALVFGMRTPISGPDHLADLPELILRGLGAAPAGALLATVSPGPLDATVRTRIIEETHGNPLALLEHFNASGRAGLAGGYGVDRADVPRRIEDQYVERIEKLPPDARLLVVLAAAEPSGDSVLIGRAAEHLHIDPGSLKFAVDAGLVDIGPNLRFRHPLARSAAYRCASAEDRYAVHGALAAVTDPQLDPDRRAWHRARSAAAPDETVAAELIESAGRAQHRGGVAASAAFWEQAVALTPGMRERSDRALAAADATYAAGDFAATQRLLVTAELGPLDELGSARAERLKAQVAFALRRGADAPPLLLRAARRLDGLNPDMACATYLQALVATVYAGRLAGADTTSEIARLVTCKASADSSGHVELLLHGLALRLNHGFVAAAPSLKKALYAYRTDGTEPRELSWLGIAYSIVAMDLWDHDAWLKLAAEQVDEACANGILSWLPFALDYLAEAYVPAGRLAEATELSHQAERIDPGIRKHTLPYLPLLLAAWRGDARATAGFAEMMVRESSSRGEGAALTYADYATAVVANGCGHYSDAAASAYEAAIADEVVISPWALYELVESAARAGQHDRAANAANGLEDIAEASGTDWARGAAARSRALLSSGRVAEDLHREAIDLFSRTSLAAHLARVRLTYGEWLRRENRRLDARRELHTALDEFVAMNLDAFAERARRELRATGERVRHREGANKPLTPQEQEIAELAREGRTNPEIGARLFISARTVEWHMSQLFVKLGIASRRELEGALSRRHTSR